ncbi:PIN domain-containing protein [Candidatus Poribacteria bacterium]|nr:PIN domain-containing protein [Candidatus Poribacteria bacterium]
MNSEKFLIDTTIWIKYLRGLDLSLKNKIASFVIEDKAVTSEIIILEILRGAKSDKDYKMLYDDFNALPKLKLNDDIWKLVWQTAYKLQRNGVNVPLADILISVISVFYNCTLIHSDKHFSFIAKHTELKTLEI